MTDASESAAWWDGLAEWHRNQLRWDAKLPLNFKANTPFDKIKLKDQQAILALRPAFDVRRSEQEALYEARERKREKIVTRLRAGYVREAGESVAEYFARCIEFHHTLLRAERDESWSVLRELLPPFCEGETIAVPLPKSSKLTGLRINLLRTPCGWTTGTDWELSGWMGSGAGAMIWPEAVEDGYWYHPTRDDALRAIVARLCKRFEQISTLVHDSVGTDAARKSCADAVPILREWLGRETTPTASPAPAAAAVPPKARQLDLFQMEGNAA